MFLLLCLYSLTRQSSPYPEMSLMDANYTMDEHLATRSLSLTPLPIGQSNKRREVIHFNEVSTPGGAHVFTYPKINGCADTYIAIDM